MTAEDIVAAFCAEPSMMSSVAREMDADSRRKLVVAGTALEWFGKDNVEKELASAQSGENGEMSSSDFERWFARALRRKEPEEVSESRHPIDRVPPRQLLMIALEAGLPFVGFGFLDNATMILAGDAIDRTIGMILHCSVMASAAMGNIVSGVMGMQFHGLVGAWTTHWCKLPRPPLSDAQRKLRRVSLASHLGGTVGIALGLTLGMLPLFAVSHDGPRSPMT